MAENDWQLTKTNKSDQKVLTIKPKKYQMLQKNSQNCAKCNCMDVSFATTFKCEICPRMQFGSPLQLSNWFAYPSLPSFGLKTGNLYLFNYFPPNYFGISWRECVYDVAQNRCAAKRERCCSLHLRKMVNLSWKFFVFWGVGGNKWEYTDSHFEFVWKHIRVWEVYKKEPSMEGQPNLS